MTPTAVIIAGWIPFKPQSWPNPSFSLCTIYVHIAAHVALQPPFCFIYVLFLYLLLISFLSGTSVPAITKAHVFQDNVSLHCCLGGSAFLTF